VAGTLSGRPEAVADDERDGEVGPVRSSKEASEQSGLGCGGARGAKGRGQGECGTAKRGPDLSVRLRGDFRSPVIGLTD
jgi:hypothetical protein